MTVADIARPLVTPERSRCRGPRSLHEEGMIQHDRLLTIFQAADRIGMRPVTLRSWANKRKIGHVKIGRCLRIPESEIRKIIECGFISAMPERQSR